MSHPAHKSNGLASRIQAYSRTNPPANEESSISTDASEEKRVDETRADLFSVNLTAALLVQTLLLVATIAFSIGTACRIILLKSMVHPQQQPGNAAQKGTSLIDQIQLPHPTVASGKDVPLTTFTSKLFAVKNAARTSNTVHLDRYSPPKSQAKDHGDKIEQIAEGGDGLHLPAGQHLLVDIKHVRPDFLNSEESLAQARVNLIEESKLTLLSYHCHSLVPMGVSCVGVLLESHISFHTWPEEGVIILDLFTCGAKPLIPILPGIKKIFSIPSSGTVGETKAGLI